MPIEEDELAYGPRMLPDGRALLFSVVKRGMMLGQSTAWDTADVAVHTLETGERRTITRGADGRVLSTGHLLYALDTVLFAVPFDLARLEVTGGPPSAFAAAAVQPADSAGTSRSAVSSCASVRPTTDHSPSFSSTTACTCASDAIPAFRTAARTS